MEGARAHRRLGRRGEGPALAHRARDGRLVAALRGAPAGRAGGRHGADGHADRDPGERDGAPLRRRPRQRRALLDRQEGARERGNRVLYFAGYKKGEDLFKREEHRGRHRPGHLVHRRRADPAPRRPQDRTFAATSCRRCSPTRRAQLGADRRSRSREVEPHHRHRLGPHDGRRRARPPRRARAAPRPATTSASAASTRRCSA